MDLPLARTRSPVAFKATGYRTAAIAAKPSSDSTRRSTEWCSPGLTLMRAPIHIDTNAFNPAQRTPYRAINKPTSTTTTSANTSDTLFQNSTGLRSTSAGRVLLMKAWLGWCRSCMNSDRLS